MCAADAQKIAEFLYEIDENHIEAEQIWIHCEGGVSRSAAVAAAIAKAWFNNDMWVFQNPNYYPNAWVNKLVTEALGEEWDEDEFKQKMKINIEIYNERCDNNG